MPMNVEDRRSLTSHVNVTSGLSGYRTDKGSSNLSHINTILVLSNQGCFLKWLIVLHFYLEVIQCPICEGLWGCATTHHHTYVILHPCCLSTRLISEQLFCVQSLFVNLYRSCCEIKVKKASNWYLVEVISVLDQANMKFISTKAM